MSEETKPLEFPDIELVSSLVHEDWMNGKRKAGVTSRKSETGEELMENYAKLSEAAKELDRSTVRTVYKSIEQARDLKK